MLIGYVSQANENDILSNENIKEKFVQGLKVGKIGLEKTFENDLIGKIQLKDMKLMHMEEELVN